MFVNYLKALLKAALKILKALLKTILKILFKPFKNIIPVNLKNKSLAIFSVLGKGQTLKEIMGIAFS